MPPSEREIESSAKNREIVEQLRESFRAATRGLTNDMEPAMVYSPAEIEERPE